MLASCDDVLVTLRDGRTATIRSAGPQDAEPIQRFIRSLSPQSRYQRFLVGFLQLPPGMLARILYAPAGRDIALVAEAQDEGAPHIVALGQFASVERESSGEVAVVVAEDWRRVGLATRLLRRVAVEAMSFGFHRADADILRDNTAAIELARRLGSEPGASPHGAMLGRMSARLELDPPRLYY